MHCLLILKLLLLFFFHKVTSCFSCTCYLLTHPKPPYSTHPKPYKALLVSLLFVYVTRNTNASILAVYSLTPAKPVFNTLLSDCT